MSREHDWRVCLFRSFRLDRGGEVVARFGNALQDSGLAIQVGAIHYGPRRPKIALWLTP